jgi:hypothetical protein
MEFLVEVSEHLNLDFYITIVLSTKDLAYELASN